RQGGVHSADVAGGTPWKERPVRVQAQPPIDAVEQRRADLRFESPQCARQRRLGDAQLRGGVGDVLDLRERDEPLQFLEVHPLTITGNAAAICVRKLALTAVSCFRTSLTIGGSPTLSSTSAIVLLRCRSNAVTGIACSRCIRPGEDFLWRPEFTSSEHSSETETRH